MSPPVERVPNDLDLPEAVDVVIIGAGVAGIGAAYALAQKGRKVAVVEKGIVAGEQSSRNWGWCRVQNRDEREIPLALYSRELWAGMSEAVEADTGFRRNGLVYVTRDPAELAQWEAWVNMARGYQAHSRMLSAEEARAMTPGNNGKWIGGVHSPHDGRAEPFIAVPAIASAARRMGVTIHQNCAVRGMETTGGAVSAVVTEKGRIRTQAVLCAAGAWSSMFCRRHGIDLPQSSVVSTIFTTTAAPEVTDGGVYTPDVTLTRRLDGGYIVAAQSRVRAELTPQGLRYARKFWKTFKSRRKSIDLGFIGRSFFDGPEALHGKWSFDRPTVFERHRVLDPAPKRSVVQPGLEAVVKSYPGLAGIKMDQIWAGWIDSTPDAVPVISAVEGTAGFFIATGFSGHGFGIGPGAGRLAADLITGDTPVVDPTPYRWSRLVDGSLIQNPGMM